MLSKFEVELALNAVRDAKKQWTDKSNKFFSDVDVLMARLLNEAAVNKMSEAKVAEYLGVTQTRVRILMRKHGLNPRTGRNLLAAQAAETLAENAALLGVEPHEFDLTSPLAYLPMGDALKKFLETERIQGSVDAMNDIDEDIDSSEYEALADTIYNAMPWEGETYQAAAESLASAVIAGGWTRVAVNA